MTQYTLSVPAHDSLPLAWLSSMEAACHLCHFPGTGLGGSPQALQHPPTQNRGCIRGNPCYSSAFVTSPCECLLWVYGSYSPVNKCMVNLRRSGKGPEKPSPRERWGHWALMGQGGKQGPVGCRLSSTERNRQGRGYGDGQQHHLFPNQLPNLVKA